MIEMIESQSDALKQLIASVKLVRETIPLKWTVPANCVATYDCPIPQAIYRLVGFSKAQGEGLRLVKVEYETYAGDIMTCHASPNEVDISELNLHEDQILNMVAIQDAPWFGVPWLRIGGKVLISIKNPTATAVEFGVRMHIEKIESAY